MPRQLTVIPGILMATWIVMACGNKGELFLPADPELVRELEQASERLQDIDAETADEDIPDKQKRKDTEAPQ